MAKHDDTPAEVSATGTASGVPPAEDQRAGRALLLDVDGTLVRSNEAHARAWAQAAQEAGYDRDAAFFQPLIGMGAEYILPRIDRALSPDTEPGKRIKERRADVFKADYLPRLEPMPGARALVEHAKDAGFLCVVATSANADESDALLRVANVADLLDASATAADASAAKPAPDIVTAALTKAAVPAAHAVLLGDTPYDVEAGTRAGVRVVALRCGGWDDAGLRGAWAIYDDPADLLAHFDSLATRQPRDHEVDDAVRLATRGDHTVA